MAFGASPNAANSNGQRACHYAASKGRLEVLRKLVHAGADCDASDATGATPCHRAASVGNVDIIEFLVNECSVNLESKNSIGQTPLIVACEAGQNEAVLRLARLGADLLGVRGARGNWWAAPAACAPRGGDGGGDAGEALVLGCGDG